MNQDTPEPNQNTPFTFISAAGTEVIITDDWVEDFTFDTSVADVIDKVTDEVYKFVLVVRDEEGVPVMHWLRRVNESCYVDTGLYAPMDYVPDDVDELCEAHAETVDNAEMELVMAIGMFPRYCKRIGWTNLAETTSISCKPVQMTSPVKLSKRNGRASLAYLS